MNRRWTYEYQKETIELLERIPEKYTERCEAEYGIMHTEPIIIMIDSTLRYVKQYLMEFGYIDNQMKELIKNNLSSYKKMLDWTGSQAVGKRTWGDSKSNPHCQELIGVICKLIEINEDEI